MFLIINKTRKGRLEGGSDKVVVKAIIIIVVVVVTYLHGFLIGDSSCLPRLVGK